MAFIQHEVATRPTESTAKRLAFGFCTNKALKSSTVVILQYGTSTPAHAAHAAKQAVHLYQLDPPHDPAKADTIPLGKNKQPIWYLVF